MQAFAKLMRSDNHDRSKYVDYIKDMKFLVDSLVPQLSGCEPKDVVKIIMTMIWDPKCKYLHPSESTEASDSDEGMPDKYDMPSEDDIMAEFPKDMLMTEVRACMLNILKHMEMSHMEAAKAMRSMKKLITQIPIGAFRLLLQATVQPHVMIQCHCLQQVKSGKPQEPHHPVSLLDMIPDGKQAQNLPVPVRTLAAILHYKLKNETGIKVSILATSTVFGTQEKSLWQALEGVYYESESQKKRWESAAHDKQEELPSSDEVDDDDDDDDEPEGAFTRIKLLKQKKTKKWDHWKKWNSDTEVTLSLQFFLWALYTHQFPKSLHHIPNSPFLVHILYFRSSCQNLQSHANSKFTLFSLSILEKQPFTLPKIKNKIKQKFRRTKKKKQKKKHHN